MSATSSDQAPGRNGLLAMLEWYQAMGVDCAVSDAPVDWLARGDVPPQRVQRQPVAGLGRSGGSSLGSAPVAAGPAASPQRRPVHVAEAAPPAAGRNFIPAAPDAAAADAREAARSASTLNELQQALSQFEGCGLKATAKNLCFYRGAEQARVMIIGEAPGRDEDRSGMPFVGRAGQLLDKMLVAIDLDERAVHITNVVYWRPPGNRTPTPQEVLVCRPFLERQIELVAPEIIVTVGGPAAKAILDTAQGIMKTRGRWAEFTPPVGAAVKVMPTLHPAYLLRTPAAKRLAWRDLLAVRSALDGTQ